MSIVWRVQLTDLAALDLIEIRLWTTEKFGKFQAKFRHNFEKGKFTKSFEKFRFV